MSLPYQIADRIDFNVLNCKGQYQPQAVTQGVEQYENILDVLLRADPANDDAQGPILIGNSQMQTFPLYANQSVNLRVTRRSDIYFVGYGGNPGNNQLAHKLHVVTARLNTANQPRP